MKFFALLIPFLVFSGPASSSYTDACSAIESQPNVQRVVTYDQNMIHAAQASRALARFALEHPSEEIKVLIQDLFSGFGRLILRFNLNPDDLRFLLESVPDARSSFSMKYEPMVPLRYVAVDDAYNMLRDAASGIFPSHFDSNFSDYASDIDTWMTAISYRMIGPSWIKNTYKKSEEMSAFIREGQPYLIPGISKEFPHREQDARYWIDDTVFECPGMTQEPYRDYPVMDGMPARYFRARSYVANSLMTGIPMRAHVSGSAPLTLAAMKFVLEKGLYSYAMNSELTQILLSGLIDFLRNYNPLQLNLIRSQFISF